MQSNSSSSPRLRLVQYWINWVSQGFADGRWDSVYRGRGFEFLGTAPFSDDPDIIRLNWPATLISDELQVSQFSEERNVSVYFLGNLSPSMAFGSEVSKLDRMAALAAVISFSSAKCKDRFKFIGYTDVLENRFPVPLDKHYPILLAQSIIDFPWQGKKRGGIVKAALNVPSTKSLVILVSDFFDEPDEIERSLKILSHKHKVIPIVLWDEKEVMLPGKGWGLYPVQDLETADMTYIFLSSRNRTKFAKNSLARREAINTMFKKYSLQPIFMIGGIKDEDFGILMKAVLSERNIV